MPRFTLLSLLLLITCRLSAQEICDNGIDDDSDGLIDLNDTLDCACGVAPVVLDDILPNPSFEDHNCIPTSYSQMNCAMFWNAGTFSTADYFRTDGYMPAFIPQPLPGGGSACTGGYFCHDYTEYIGGCLLSPMLAGTSYSLNMSVAAVEIDNFLTNTTTLDLSPVNITIYGLASCPSFPTSISLCPGTEGWTELGYATYTPSNEWGDITITFTPTFDVAAIIIGSPCTLPVDYPNVVDPWLAYFLMDEMSISTTGSVGAPIASEGNFCDGDLVITAHADSTTTGYQWYQNGIAISGASDTVLAISALSLEPEHYMFRAVSDTSCTLTTFNVEAEIEPQPYIALTVDGLWCPLIGTFQWFLDGTLIPGATGAYYLPTQNGIYTVELTNALGCSALSYPFDWIGMATTPVSGEGMDVYFSQEEMAIRVRGVQGPSVLTVSDASGRVVMEKVFTGQDHLLSMASLSRGAYVARINDRSLRFVR